MNESHALTKVSNSVVPLHLPVPVPLWSLSRKYKKGSKRAKKENSCFIAFLRLIPKFIIHLKLASKLC